MWKIEIYIPFLSALSLFCLFTTNSCEITLSALYYGMKLHKQCVIVDVHVCHSLHH